MQGDDALDELIRRDPRYTHEAYRFVLEALGYTIEQLGEHRHVTGRELLYGARDLALDCWGLMARHVLPSWGIRSTDDVGEIVFNMIDTGLLAKTDQDKREDFSHVYGFADAFDASYSPEFDEYGHIRRKLPNMLSREGACWIPLIGAIGLN